MAADEAAVQLDADAVSEKERLMYERLAQEVAVGCCTLSIQDCCSTNCNCSSDKLKSAVV